MRKLLLMFLIIILLVGLGVMTTKGLTIGNFEVPSIKEIINKNDDLDKQIAALDNSIETDYASAKLELDTSVKNLQSAKQKYQDTINYSTDDEIKVANQTEKYEISFIWTKIGMYATKNNIVMKADVSNGTVSDLYNISFTATGEYLDISEFINSIEKDTDLGFKIEEFTLVPYSEEKLQASFVVKNISIDKDSLTASGTVISSSSNSTTRNSQNTLENTMVEE